MMTCPGHLFTGILQGWFMYQLSWFHRDNYNAQLPFIGSRGTRLPVFTATIKVPRFPAPHLMGLLNFSQVSCAPAAFVMSPSH